MNANYLAGFKAIVCLGLLLTLNALPAYAQLSSAGTFSGLVTDQQGAGCRPMRLCCCWTHPPTQRREP